MGDNYDEEHDEEGLTPLAYSHQVLRTNELGGGGRTLAAELVRLNDLVEELQEQVARYKPYYDAVDEALVCSWIGVAKGNPAEELKALELQAMRLALDPCVSEEAANMVGGTCYYVSNNGDIYFGRLVEGQLEYTRRYFNSGLVWTIRNLSGTIGVSKLTGPYYSFSAAEEADEFIRR